jgi:hypothetical protein
MWKPHAGLQFVGVLVACALLALATSAVADTIYLKNGRIIHTGTTRVEGDNVIFTQFGGEVTIPMSEVDRIEEDEMTEPEPIPVSQPAPPTEQDPAVDPDDPNAPATDDPNAPLGDDDARMQREYWQERLGAIDAEREQLNTRLEELRREERAFLFSRRSTADTRRRIEETNARLEELDQEEADLRDEARRLGIPPGWLRVARTSGGGG